MHYATCDGCNQSEALELIPMTGAFCDRCRVILSAPFCVEGCIPSASIQAMAESTDREFRERGQKLRRSALQLIQNERATVER
jgi:hypothetical protein